MKKHTILYLYLAFTMALSAACTAQAHADGNTPQGSGSAPSLPQVEPKQETIATSEPAVAEVIPVTGHLMTPAEIAPAPGKMIDDVESSGTGPEGRAPYGDSYKLNRFERPFLQDMTYVPDMDIHKFGVSEDQDWYYLSVRLVGNDPNHALGIHYGAEIDLNADGFGDYVIWARPPYTDQWDTGNLHIFKDSNLDAGGLSAIQADAVFDGNGYDTLVFDGSAHENADPDLAWVRMTEDPGAMIQFAFKKSLTGPFFMMGVISDMGLKDVSKYDYADHFTEADAGSPVRSNKYFPLGSLYAVDNTCWEAYGMQTTGYEPKLCQPIVQPTQIPSRDPLAESQDAVGQPVPACSPEPVGCLNGFDPTTCECNGAVE